VATVSIENRRGRHRTGAEDHPPAPQRDSSDVERRAPLPIAVLSELQVPPLSVQSHRDEPDAAPGVEPAVQESQLGRARRELEEAEGGA